MAPDRWQSEEPKSPRSQKERNGQVKAAQPVAAVEQAAVEEMEGEVCCPSALDAPLGQVRALELARGYAALGDPARLQILSILGAAPSGEVCVCELVGPVGKSQPTVSHHLKVLGDAGLVEGERRGKWVWYRLLPDRVAGLRAALSSG